MGLLDFLSSDDARLGIGLLAAGGYQPTNMTAAQRIAQALQGETARKQEASKASLLKAQIDQLTADSEFKRKQQPLLLSELELKNARHKRLGNIAGGLLGEFPESGVATPSAGAGEASASPQGVAMAGFGGNFDRELRFAQALALEDPASGKAQIEILKMKYPDLGEHQGILFNKRTGQPVSTMPFGTAAGNVIQYQPLPGGGYGVTTPSGSADVLRSQKRIDAEEGARVKPHERGPLFPGGHPISTNQLEASQGFPNLQPPAIVPPPATAPPAPSAAGNQSLPATSADAYRRTPEYSALTPQERANFDMVAAREQLGQVTTTDQNIGPRRSAPMIGVLPRSAVPPNAAGMTPEDVTAQKAKEAGLTKKTELDAVRIDDVEKKLPSLYSTLSRLDKMEALTKDDKTFAAAGAELKSDLGRIAQAFGLKVMPEKTANTEAYMAHVAELLKERLASKDYGAGTGISNLDLVAAGRPLPQVMNTVGGRLKIINALREDARRSIADIEAASDYFDKNKTMSGFRYPSADDPNRVIEMRRTKDGRVLMKRASGLIEAMK